VVLNRGPFWVGHQYADFKRGEGDRVGLGDRVGWGDDAHTTGWRTDGVIA